MSKYIIDIPDQIGFIRALDNTVEVRKAVNVSDKATVYTMMRLPVTPYKEEKSTCKKKTTC